jgi:transposase
VWRCRVDCPRCGPKLEALPWLEPYARVTKRLAQSVARLCRVLPIRHVAEHFGLHWHTGKAIDKAHLEQEPGPPDFTGVDLLLIDEFALRKGHRYATMVADAATKRVLWVGKGRSREEVRVLFDLLGRDGCARIKAVGMDMSQAFAAEVRLHCPQAEIVYDLFHAVAKYGKEVVDAIRVAEANRLRHDKPARKLIKSAKWLLLRNKANLPDRESRVRLKEVLKANQALMTADVLKDDLKQLWAYVRESWARRAWEDWLERPRESGIKPLIHFAERLTAYLPGILAHGRWSLHTSLLEGINNKIKVIKRMAYGYRDDAYFFLKIRSAFPGIPR